MSTESGLETEGAKCPVIKAWSELPLVVSRAGQGKLVDLGKDWITREAVSHNADVLEPIIKEYGSLAQVKTITSCRIGKKNYHDICVQKLHLYMDTIQSVFCLPYLRHTSRHPPND